MFVQRLGSARSSRQTVHKTEAPSENSGLPEFELNLFVSFLVNEGGVGYVLTSFTAFPGPGFRQVFSSSAAHIMMSYVLTRELGVKERE